MTNPKLCPQIPLQERTCCPADRTPVSGHPLAVISCGSTSASQPCVAQASDQAGHWYKSHAIYVWHRNLLMGTLHSGAPIALWFDSSLFPIPSCLPLAFTCLPPKPIYAFLTLSQSSFPRSLNELSGNSSHLREKQSLNRKNRCLSQSSQKAYLKEKLRTHRNKLK